MIYEAYQARRDLLKPLRVVADLTATALRAPQFGPLGNLLARTMAATAELVSDVQLTHERPDYRIGTVTVAGREAEVTEEAALTSPFGTLLHFRKSVSLVQPRLLLVAPMAGHFATLLRDTVRTLLADHDVFITDWKNARDVPREAGVFGFDDYVEHVIRFIEFLGPPTHVMAVCQPCNAVLSATAIMAQSQSTAQPRSLTLMAGPVDTRVNPTKVNELATGHPIEWFAQNLIDTVPARYRGAHRRVYPGFLQLSAFLAMNLPRHIRAHLDLFENIVKSKHDKAQMARDFYQEYFAVLDLPAEFYLETVQRVFQEQRLARGYATFRGGKVEPRVIRRTALLTVEGEKDDICSPGQTVAAHDLTSGIRASRKRHHLQPGVGHYGVFAGKKWQREIYPLVRSHILASE